MWTEKSIQQGWGVGALDTRRQLQVDLHGWKDNGGLRADMGKTDWAERGRRTGSYSEGPEGQWKNGIWGLSVSCCTLATARRLYHRGEHWT